MSELEKQIRDILSSIPEEKEQDKDQGINYEEEYRKQTGKDLITGEQVVQ